MLFAYHIIHKHYLILFENNNYDYFLFQCSKNSEVFYEEM